MNAKRHTLINAIRIAAEEYEKAAQIDPNLRDTFTRQALEAREMADAIEEADTIRLQD